MRLSPVLTPDDLPAPELAAARLDGELFALDGGFCPVDEIEQPLHRALALHAGHSGKLIGEQLSAAWVWGALDSAPSHQQFCVATGARVSHTSARWMTVREVVIETDEIAALGSALVTTPARTVADLVRFADSFGPREAEVVARLAAMAGLSLDDTVRSFQRRRNLPNKRRAVERLALCALPVAALLSAD
ncbi:hypothetical protein BH09ACT5_BH09ACT5_15310 [soil metagenome]